MINYEPASERHFFTGDKTTSHVPTQGFITQFKQSSLSPMQIRLEDRNGAKADEQNIFLWKISSDSSEIQSLELARNTKQLAVSETKSRRRLGSDTPFCAGTSAQTLAQALFSGSRHALNSTSRGFGSALFTSTLYWFHSGPALRHHAHGQRCCHHRLCSTGYL